VVGKTFHTFVHAIIIYRIHLERSEIWTEDKSSTNSSGKAKVYFTTGDSSSITRQANEKTASWQEQHSVPKAKETKAAAQSFTEHWTWFTKCKVANSLPQKALATRTSYHTLFMFSKPHCVRVCTS